MVKVALAFRYVVKLLCGEVGAGSAIRTEPSAEIPVATTKCDPPEARVNPNSTGDPEATKSRTALTVGVSMLMSVEFPTNAPSRHGFKVCSPFPRVMNPSQILVPVTQKVRRKVLRLR